MITWKWGLQNWSANKGLLITYENDKNLSRVCRDGVVDALIVFAKKHVRSYFMFFQHMHPAALLIKRSTLQSRRLTPSNTPFTLDFHSYAFVWWRPSSMRLKRAIYFDLFLPTLTFIFLRNLFYVSAHRSHSSNLDPLCMYERPQTIHFHNIRLFRSCSLMPRDPIQCITVATVTLYKSFFTLKSVLLASHVFASFLRRLFIHDVKYLSHLINYSCLYSSWNLLKKIWHWCQDFEEAKEVRANFPVCSEALMPRLPWDWHLLPPIGYCFQ